MLYPNAFVLMEHLVSMGEGLASHNRKISVGKETFLAMAAAYQRLSHSLSSSLTSSFYVDLYGTEDGNVEASFQVCPFLFYLIL